MKKVVLILITLFLFTNVYGQRRLKKLEVNEIGYEIKMNFEPLKERINYKGMTIQITPVSPDDLNDLFFKEALFNGKFEYTQYEKSREAYFLKRKKRKRTKSDLEFLLEGLSWLSDNDLINESEFEELEKDILYYYEEDYAKEYYEENVLTNANPYFMDPQYLSLFKVTFENPSSQAVSIDKGFVLENGTTLMENLKSETFFESLDSLVHISLPERLILERHNYNQSITIPANSKVEKLISFLPVNFNSSNVSISIEGEGQKFEWRINRDQKFIDNLYKFYELKLSYRVDWDTKFSIIRGDTESIFLDYDKIYISEENLTNQFEIFTIAINKNILKYGRNTGLKGADYVNLEKNRRDKIYLDLERIDEVKKKVKE